MKALNTIKDFNKCINDFITNKSKHKIIVNDIVKNFLLHYEYEYSKNCDMFSTFLEALTSKERLQIQKTLKESTNIQLVLNTKKGGCKYLIAYFKGACILTLNDDVNIDDIDIYKEFKGNEESNYKGFKDLKQGLKTIDNLINKIEQTIFEDSNDYDDLINKLKTFVESKTN